MGGIVDGSEALGVDGVDGAAVVGSEVFGDAVTSTGGELEGGRAGCTSAEVEVDDGCIVTLIRAVSAYELNERGEG